MDNTENIDNYDAILVRGTPRYRYNRKMIAADKVPAHIKALVDARLYANQPLATEVAPGVASQVAAPVAAQVGAQAQVSPVTHTEEVPPNLGIVKNTAKQQAPQQAPSEFEMELIAENEKLRAELVESYTAAKPVNSPEHLARQLYEATGIYTTLLGQPPTANDVHPFTGELMTRYEVGLAYQSYRKFEIQGTTPEPTVRRDQAVAAAEGDARHMEQFAYNQGRVGFMPQTTGTFEERTNIHGAEPSTHTVTRTNDPISEDMTAEPNFRGQTVREVW